MEAGGFPAVAARLGWVLPYKVRAPSLELDLARRRPPACCPLSLASLASPKRAFSFSFSYRIAAAPGQARKSKGYWEDIEVVREEVEAFVAEGGADVSERLRLAPLPLSLLSP